MPQHHLPLLTLLTSLILALACGLSPNLTLPPTPAPSQPQPPGLTSISAGLADLQSYRANLMVDFAGTRTGQLAKGRLESLIEVTRRPDALHQYLEVDAAIPNSEIITGRSEFYRLEEKVYVKRGDAGDWFTFTDSTVSPADLDFFALDRLIIVPSPLPQPSQPERLDGVTVRRFAFTERDLSDPNIIFEKAEGDMWVAEAGNYLAQYVLSATLRIVIPDPQAHIFDQGHINLRYTLSDVNAQLAITPPVDAFSGSAALNNLPRLPDAQIVSLFPTFVEYTSSITPVKAALFYRDQLTAQGWTENQADIFNEKARLAYAKDKAALTIIITPAGEADKINVLLDIR